MLTIMKLLYFMIPAYFSNTAPIYFSKIFPRWNTPIDFGKSMNRQRIFGKNKTWRGIVSAILMGTIAFSIQKYLYSTGIFTSISIFNYSQMPLHFGFFMASGAILGDLIESFFKRRKNIGSGKPWIPFDQIDYSVGAILFTAPFFFPGALNSLLIIIINALLHVATNHIGFYLNIRKSKL